MVATTIEVAEANERTAIRNFLAVIKKQIKKDFGKRCSGFEIDCFTCRAWLAVDILSALYEADNNLEKKKERKNAIRKRT